MTKSVSRDLSSLGNPHEVKLTHLDWKVKVDFTEKIFRASATYKLEGKGSVLQLDTAHLDIEAVKDANSGDYLTYKLKPGKKTHLGTQLEIQLANSANERAYSVAIFYRTTGKATAIQWLPPAQTSGKKYPYLFTQCQAIHARSMVPCQDQPGVKMTYHATVTAPAWATCVMSAVHKKTDVAGDEKTFVWEQKVPVSSYLLAMAVGDLAKRNISDRCAIWSEPAMVQAAANDFAQTEDFLQMAEEIAGMPYQWGRYDLLCLPPSFPYGGMENPCLTFVTPTLLAGDRSLADVVAHEIAHSWTGNYVTNATWDHFWLNEGWTRWFDRKIMARIHEDNRYIDFDALSGLKDLQDTVNGEMPEQFQSLILPIGDGDPDDSYSTIAYEKGFLFLTSLERRVGTPQFESFFKAYVKEFGGKTLTSQDFREFFLKQFKDVSSVKDVDWEAWFFSPGMPPEAIDFDHSLAESSEKLANDWLDYDRNDGELPSTSIASWSCQQTTCFLDVLQTLSSSQALEVTTLNDMNKQYKFAESHNSEILFRYCQLSIASEDKSMIMVILDFITSQGRMKFVRPLYRALYASEMGKDAAVSAFLENRDFYHPICSKMVASDLMIQESPKLLSRKVITWVAIAAVASGIGLVLARRRR